jgi:hypothetical protein
VSRWRGGERAAIDHVPVPLTHLIGRQAELEDARRSLLDPQVNPVTLTGAPGPQDSPRLVRPAHLLDEVSADTLAAYWRAALGLVDQYALDAPRCV